MALTHLNAQGEVHQVDVSGKPATLREARAEAFVRMSDTTLAALRDGALEKGDVLAVARVAGIQAAKQTALLIPLCHGLPLESAAVDISVEPGGLRIETVCRVTGRTGVEMEALTAATVAALTLYDMCKSQEKGITIERVRLLSKSGGRSGDWSADRGG